MGQPVRNRIVFCATHSVPGGVLELWENLAEAFAQRHFDTQLLALYPDDPSPAAPRSAGWHHLTEQRPTSARSALRLLSRLVRMFRDEPVLAVFTAMPLANVLVPLAVSLSRTKTQVVTSHHVPMESHRPGLDTIDGMTGQLASVKAIVSVSQAVESSLAPRMGRYRRKSRVIHNALPPHIERLLETLAIERGEPRQRHRRLVSLGRLSPQKNFPVLIRACALIADVQVQIVGSGPEEAKLKALAAELGVTSRVQFLGQVDREQAMRVLAEGDIFVQPSLFEGHSLALIEAGKLGLPLVVSNIPVQIEGITATDGSVCGLSADPNDAAGIAQACTRLLEDPDTYRHWCDRSRHLAQSHSFRAMFESYKSLVV